LIYQTESLGNKFDIVTDFVSPCWCSLVKMSSVCCVTSVLLGVLLKKKVISRKLPGPLPLFHGLATKLKPVHLISILKQVLATLINHFKAHFT
jgi:hypothetical protein